MIHTLISTRPIVAALLLALLCAAPSMAQKHDFANWQRYEQQNRQLGAPLPGEKRVVLMGNSITDNWPDKRPAFFTANHLIGRGISGQTSYQFVLRFHEDVVKLQPKVVVINYGTNDVAENTGAYSEEHTLNNVMAMVEMARQNKIKVILASCLPHHSFPWRTSVTGAIDKIRSLNARVQHYARAQKIPYVDYFSAMVSADGTRMRPDLSDDGVHPNEAGYQIMEALLLPVIEKLR